MRKFIILLIPIFVSSIKAQIGIGTTMVDSSAILEIQSTKLGVLLPRMSTVERDRIKKPAEGLVIYNQSKTQIEIYRDNEWGSIFDSYSNSGLVYIKDGVVKAIPLGLSGQYLRVNDSGELYWHGASPPIGVRTTKISVGVNNSMLMLEVDSNGGSEITLFGLYIGDNLDSLATVSPVYKNSSKTIDTFTLNGLVSNKTYYYKGYFQNNLGITYSNVDSFKTKDFPSILHTGQMDTSGDYLIHQIKSSQTIRVVNDGYIELLLVGGGQSSNGVNGGRGAGAVYVDSWYVDTGYYNIEIGQSNQDSKFDTLLIAVRGGGLQSGTSGSSKLFGFEGSEGGTGTSSFSASGSNGRDGNAYPLPSPNSYFQGGGGGGTRAGTPGSGGLGGGGRGNSRGSSSGSNNASANTGGGAGGVGYYPGNTSGSGGSGILVIKHRYK